MLYSHAPFWITRTVFLRGLGAIYFVGFLILLNQVIPLLGEQGLLPIELFLKRVEASSDSRLGAFLSYPSIFWLDHSDLFLLGASYLGLGLSIVACFGRGNSVVYLLLWALYLSFVNTGQLFYGYGWETLLLEAGFLSIFLAPFLRVEPYPKDYPPPKILIWLVRWTLFRVMFGAGLIKLRSGDACWREFTCLIYHYETQPLANPLSWYIHQMPEWFHKLGVLFNHIVELVVPWFYFAPRKLAAIAGLLTILFQGMLILSGNLSFLNWLTIVLCLCCFEDSHWRALFGDRTVLRMPRVELGRVRRVVTSLLVLLICCLSIAPTLNLISPKQRMNASFDSLHLVNTYGAFGAVGKRRAEIVLEGTQEAIVTEGTIWREYEFKCKPGSVDRAPCVIAPYQYRLDWQIWFAAMSRIDRQPWLIHLVAKLLVNDKSALSLLEHNPFVDAPPKHIRARLYIYSFTSTHEEGGAWWRRKLVGDYFRPLSLQNAELRNFLERRGWLARLGLSKKLSKERSEEGVRIMPLGDSITEGESGWASYRYWLWQLLKNDGFTVNFVGSQKGVQGGYPLYRDFDWDHESYWGWSVDQVLRELPKSAKQTKPEIVLLHLGTNDVWQEQPTGEIIEEMRAVIGVLRKEVPSVTIFLSTIIPTDRGLDPYLLREYNSELRRLAEIENTERSRVILVDQWVGFDPDRYLYDGIHPNEEGEKKIAETWFEALKGYLEEEIERHERIRSQGS